MNADDDPAGLAAGHALGSLTPDEEVAYQAYLAESAAHRDEADGLADVARLLRRDAAEIVPTPDLKRRIMAQIAAMPQNAPTGAQDRQVAAPDEAPGKTSATSQTRVAASERARRRWFRRPLTIVLAAAAAAVIIFAGGLATGVAVHPATTTVAESGTLAQIATAPDAQRATAPVAGGGQATLVWSADTGEAALVSDSMRAAPAGKTYQLWIIRDGKAASAGFLPTHDGHATWQVLTGAVHADDTIGITVEPDGGSPQPTTKPIALIATS